MRAHDDDAAFAAELRGLRPALGPEVAGRLDERVAALRAETGRPAALLAWQRFRSAPPRRQLAPVLASGLAALAVATAVIASNGDSGPGAPTPRPVPVSAAPAIEAARPSAGVTAGPAQSTNRAAGSAEGTSRAAAPAASVPVPQPGPFATGERRRFDETSAELTLGTEPARVRDVSDQVFGVVGRYEGIVLSSSISDGPEGQAGARFSLLIPSAKLSDALADLSSIAEVRSRSQNSLDITAPVVSTRENLRDARAEVEGLLKQLVAADTDAKRAAVKAQLAFQHRRVAGLRATLNSLRRRANLSRVSLDVLTGDAVGLATGGRQWTIGDALHDAGRVLAIAAGVALVGLAGLAPLAILALLAWSAFGVWLRASRERALRGVSGSS